MHGGRGYLLSIITNQYAINLKDFPLSRIEAIIFVIRHSPKKFNKKGIVSKERYGLNLFPTLSFGK
jgi:hypothetical protein